MTTRREFLLGGAAVAASLSGASCASAPKPIPPGGRVVVVGAGFAGLGAAGKLKDAGYRVELVEAADRVGGRAHSVSLGGFPADLGANWLKVSNNELMPSAKQLGLLSARSNLRRGSVRYGGETDVLDVADLEAALEPALVLPYVRHQVMSLLGGRPRASSAAELIGSSLDEAPKVACAGRRLLAGVYAADLDDLSGDVLIGAGGEAGPTADELIEPTVVGGMQALAEALSAPLRPSFNESVDVIARTTDGVRVETDRRTIEADAAIVTVSVGVLKSRGIRFEPELPRHHQEVLDGMGMGSFAKLWIRYPEAKWSLSTDILVPCDTDDVHAIVDFSKSHGAPVLLAWAAGEQGRALEAMSDAEARALLHATLQEQLGIRLPDPTGFAKNRWTQDPLVQGSYMYPNVQYRAGDNLRLREPITDRILLAGEALAPDFGYVDSAWSDGRRAAGSLIA